MIGPNSLIHITPSLFVTRLGGCCHTSRVSDGLTAHLTPAISATVLKSAHQKIFVISFRRREDPVDCRSAPRRRGEQGGDAARADPCCKTDRKRDSPSRVDIGFDADAAGERRLARTKPCCDSSVKLG
jgi:hypothetical protein